MILDLLELAVWAFSEWREQRRYDREQVHREWLDERLLEVMTDPDVKMDTGLKLHAPGWSIGERPPAIVVEEVEDEDED